MNRPKLKRDWVGLTVKSLTPLRNGRYIIPAGTWFKVERNHNGLHLWSLGCHSCGIRVFINHVSEGAVEIMPEKCSCGPTDAYCLHGQADRPSGA